MYDYHVHSHFSEDSSADMLSICQSAISNNLKGICFTDHIDIDYPGYKPNTLLSYKHYVEEINMCKKIFREKLNIYVGIELGLQVHTTNQNKDFLAGKYFDFIIGSIHCVDKKEMYGLEYLEGLSDSEAIDHYFNDLLLSIEYFNDFDVIGHIDVFRRYLANSESSFDFKVHKEKMELVLSKIINMGKGIEINTSGLRYNLSSFHPLVEIIQLYKKLKGEIITLGSDSHVPMDLGYGFQEAKELLMENGFKYYTIFKARQPQFIKLDE